MKVCLVNNLYKPYDKGGAEKVVESMAADFIADGHQVFVISTLPRFSNTKTLVSQTRNTLINFYYLKSFYYDLNLFPLILRLFWHLYDMFDLRSALKIKKILKNENADLVITHNLKGLSYLLPKIISKLGAKHIHVLHDVQLYYPSGIIIFGQENKVKSLLARLYAYINSFLFGHIENVVSPSGWLMREHEKRGFFTGSKKIILPLIKGNFFEKHRIIEKKFIFKEGGNFIFLYAGQIEEYKGVLLLVDTFNRLCQKFPQTPMILLVAGKGTLIEKVKSFTNKNVIFLNNLKTEEILDVMNIADCLIVPSICYENSPSVIYEAISARLPVLASRIGGITELIHKYGGVLFEPLNAFDLMNKMELIILNNKKMSQAAVYSCQKLKKNQGETLVERLADFS